MQSRASSLIESLINIAIGAVVSFLSQLLIFPLFAIDVSLAANLGITAWFTAVSVARSYIVRRWFNARLHASAYLAE